MGGIGPCLSRLPHLLHKFNSISQQNLKEINLSVLQMKFFLKLKEIKKKKKVVIFNLRLHLIKKKNLRLHLTKLSKNLFFLSFCFSFPG